ncbi:phosphodiester glycosidase family protein [Tahibacter caeni]|uniref:phosphodiester glycosidase family protein n=1 Tax=Tahibacter caeni TaxID=1453545 RepID=UPI0021480BBF|nr:phosphodiester glycosidase family protein [Tahibacter caeni]
MQRERSRPPARADAAPPSWTLRRRAVAVFGLLFGGLHGVAAVGPEAACTVVDVDLAHDRLALFLDDDAQRPFLSLRRLDAWLQRRGRRLRWGMNAGMFHPGFRPVGLFVADGIERSPLDLGDGTGNFYLKPNGVFLVGAGGAQIVEASRYADVATGVQLATQSGPLLLQHGALHPRLDPASRSRHVRNGVGICGGRVRFVISERPVTLHAFATYFRDVLQCSDALYFDGSVSSFYARTPRRDTARARLGPLIGVVDAIGDDAEPAPPK